MAGLAYLFPPISGLIAYLRGGSARTRFHGLQAISIGVVWPLLAWVAARVSAVGVAAVFVLGAATLVVLGVAAALGRDVALGPAGRWLRRAAEERADQDADVVAMDER